MSAERTQAEIAPPLPSHREAERSILDAALAYAKRGLPVFPVRGKFPLTEHGFYDASTDAGTIRAWWSRMPDANVALPTGSASRLVVLDVDPRHGGNESLAALDAKHGRLPATLQSQTGGGGRHFFFALAKGQLIRNSTGKLGPGLDVRGDGGYVVISPSSSAAKVRCAPVNCSHFSMLAPTRERNWSGGFWHSCT